MIYSGVCVMAKDMKLALLLDFYGGLLTKKQECALDGYYNQDLSLAEIADEMGISRQGVMSFLKQGEKHLRGFEQKLGLAERFTKISDGLKRMRDEAQTLDDDKKRERFTELIDGISAVI